MTTKTEHPSTVRIPLIREGDRLAAPVATFDGYDGDTCEPLFTVTDRAALRPGMSLYAAASPAAPAAELPPLPEPLEINWPELHSQALGCGVEDRGIHDRYEAAEYGWQDGIDKAIERVPEEIYDADQMRAYGAACAAAALAGALVVEAAPTIPAELMKIGELLRTQDNRYTDQPMFTVQQLRRITGLDPDYCDDIVWLHSEDDFSEAEPEEAARLEAEYQSSFKMPSGWMRTGYVDQWEFVTACLTEQGCKDYLALDGHNLNEPRIYADGSYRNNEFRAVRNWLMSLAAPAPGASK